MKEKTKIDLSTVVLSPMTGVINNVNVKPGDMVSEGQELVVMEAMKMQNSLHAGKTGRVKALNVKVGATVDEEKVLVEEFIDNPRHIEMQILCDKHGNALWLNERECSIQRRNQKVIEEAPSSFVPPEMRRKMGERAVQLAKAVGYDSAGTVEFLVDSQRNFYFLEMNTRLQVEHPITECITGIDNVQQMLRVAYGHSLPITQEQVPLNGWAFESRVYAEDPYKGFGLPSVGRLSKYVEPRHVEGVRCDSGIREGSEISIYYDPLICKLVTHGDNREQALNRMGEAPDNYVIRGVTHNIPLLREIVQEKRFRSGDITTKYLPEVYPEGFQGATLTPSEQDTVLAFASALNVRKLARANQFLNQERQRSTHVASFAKTYKFVSSLPAKEGEKPKEHAVEVTFLNGDANQAQVSIGGKVINIKGNANLALPVNSLEVNGEHVTTQIVGKRAGEITVLYKGTPFKVKVLPEQAIKYLRAKMYGGGQEVLNKENDTTSEGTDEFIDEYDSYGNEIPARVKEIIRSLQQSNKRQLRRLSDDPCKPRQTDGVNCGPYILGQAREWIMGTPWQESSTPNMDVYRMEILLTLLKTCTCYNDEIEVTEEMIKNHLSLVTSTVPIKNQNRSGTFTPIPSHGQTGETYQVNIKTESLSVKISSQKGVKMEIEVFAKNEAATSEKNYIIQKEAETAMWVPSRFPDIGSNVSSKKLALIDDESRQIHETTSLGHRTDQQHRKRALEEVSIPDAKRPKKQIKFVIFGQPTKQHPTEVTPFLDALNNLGFPLHDAAAIDIHTSLSSRRQKPKFISQFTVNCPSYECNLITWLNPQNFHSMHKNNIKKFGNQVSEYICVAKYSEVGEIRLMQLFLQLLQQLPQHNNPEKFYSILQLDTKYMSELIRNTNTKEVRKAAHEFTGPGRREIEIAARNMLDIPINYWK